MIQVIPAIDLIDGKCVRLTQGNYEQKKIYNEHPLEVAKLFEGAGIRRLHLVDLDGAKQKKIINHKTLEQIALKTTLEVDFGGGIQSDEDISVAFNYGAAQVTGGSIAVRDPDLFLKWLDIYGAEKIILGADAQNEHIAVSGWQENTDVWVYDFIEDFYQKGIKYTISTDIAKDGLLQGPSVDLYRKIQETTPQVRIIASGGVSNMKDIETLNELNLYGVIVGKAIYEGRISLDQIMSFLC